VEDHNISAISRKNLQKQWAWIFDKR